MDISRRRAIVTATVAPLALSYTIAALADQPKQSDQPDQPSASSGAAGDTAADVAFTPPPGPPTDAELALVATAVEAARHDSASSLVQDARFLSLHPQPLFRELVKAVARDPDLTIARDDEPGTRIVATGTIQDASGQPVSGALVYAYHTSAKGWYSDKAAHIRAWAGDVRHARLFGYLRTGKDGSFTINTIRPGGYPRSTLPQHIHFEVEADGYRPTSTELLFDDDPRLTAEVRDDAKRSGFLIAAQSSGSRPTPTFSYKLILRRV